MAKTDTERRLEALEVGLSDVKEDLVTFRLFEREIRTWVKAAALLGPIVTTILVVLIQRWLG